MTFVRVMSLEWVGGVLVSASFSRLRVHRIGFTDLGVEYQFLFPNRSFDSIGSQLLRDVYSVVEFTGSGVLLDQDGNK